MIARNTCPYMTPNRLRKDTLMAEFILTFMRLAILFLGFGLLLGVAVLAATYIASYITTFSANGTRGVTAMNGRCVNGLTPEHAVPLNRSESKTRLRYSH